LGGGVSGNSPVFSILQFFRFVLYEALAGQDFAHLASEIFAVMVDALTKPRTTTPSSSPPQLGDQVLLNIDQDVTK